MNRSPPTQFAHPSFHGCFGIARVDITPPIGIYCRNWGAAQHDVADSIHRPLTLTALSLSESPQSAPLVLIDADLGWWKTPQTFERFQRHLLEELSLDPAQLIFALTHTHAGPPLMQGDDSCPGNDLLQQWMETVIRSTVDAVGQAWDSTFQGIVDWDVGRCGLATVRDLPDPESETGRILCGYDPDGDPDDTMLLGRITDMAGSIRATLINYACHPTTLAAENTAISPDYIGAMRETIQQVTAAPALFLLGACGDLAPRYQYVGETRIADRHGQQLGFAALATLSGMEPAGTQLSYDQTLESGAPLAIWKHGPRELPKRLRAVRRTVELPLKNWPSADDLEQQRIACTDRAVEERLRRQRDIRLGLGDGSTFQLPIYAWRIGDAILVGCCCEPYSVLQQELRRRFDGHTVICMNLINGSIGYLPPAELYDSDVYPVWQTPFARGSLETTIEAMTSLVGEALGN